MPTVAKLATRWCRPLVRPPAEARAVPAPGPALPFPTALPEATEPTHAPWEGAGDFPLAASVHTGVSPSAGDSGPAAVPTAPCNLCIPIPPAGRLQAARAADPSHTAALGSELGGLADSGPTGVGGMPFSRHHLEDQGWTEHHSPELWPWAPLSPSPALPAPPSAEPEGALSEQVSGQSRLACCVRGGLGALDPAGRTPARKMPTAQNPYH